MTPDEEIRFLRTSLEELRRTNQQMLERLLGATSAATTDIEALKDRIARQESRIDNLLNALALPKHSRRAILEKLMRLD